MKQFIGKTVWNFCEFFNINLGGLTPSVFGWRIGHKGKRVK